jgi:type I restriction enzyme M protein
MAQKDLDNWSGRKMPKLTLDKLESFLWKSADILRGSIDSSEYKHFIFGLLFLKRLSDQFQEEYKQIKDDPEDRDNYKFYVPKRARWSSIRKVSEGIGGAIDKAFAALEEENEALQDVLVPIEFGDTKRLKDETLSNLIIHFSQKEYNLTNSNLSDPDILGRAYEYLIKQFADDSGKKGGEFYTPNGVVRTLIKILQPEEGMRICDPACGSGGMLIECFRYLKETGQNPENLTLFGQEKNRNTWAIAKMNMLLHNILDAEIRHADTMADPMNDDGHLRVFDMVIANPMWNQKEWSKSMFDKGDPYGRVLYEVPSQSSGDWMWVQHMCSTLNSTGRMGVVLDNGALFRGNREMKCRKGFIEDDLIEGIVALPANLFYNTGSPGCLIIINRSKSDELKEKIFFIHAENEYEEGSGQNFLKEKHIERISKTYQEKSIIEKFSDLIDIQEIRENDYNLNVSRYVDILPEEKPIDITECLKNIEEIKRKRRELEEQFKNYMKELDFSW